MKKEEKAQEQPLLISARRRTKKGTMKGGGKRTSDWYGRRTTRDQIRELGSDHSPRRIAVEDVLVEERVDFGVAVRKCGVGA